MAERNARMELVNSYTYLEDYNEKWEQLPDVFEEHGSDSEKFKELRSELDNAIPEQSEEEVEERMHRAIEDVFTQEYNIVQEDISQNGDEYEITVVIELLNISPSYRPNARLERSLDSRFDSNQMI